ncbi:hypothetical protein [Virgisporangium aurantiacum]|uniref:Uncharacterized protein n=1 Tax=Virgisporangium aurantiacum TaxID=175570 RepID=A0A8J3Z4R5_9ACTN|nr:hypothetical protein [Virgisporangium aurantiacum]GIJ55013.1 hypothetical protein Vau01_025290 [Virgisporangium aurantiacum]
MAGDPPVPITVWQVADDDPYGHHTDGLTGRTAQLLIGLYTRVGDTSNLATLPKQSPTPSTSRKPRSLLTTPISSRPSTQGTLLVDLKTPSSVDGLRSDPA